MQHRSWVLVLALLVASGCSYSRHHDAVESLVAMPVVAEAARVEEMPILYGVWTVPDASDGVAHHIVGQVRVTRSEAAATIAEDWLPARPRASTLEVQRCADGWVFRLPDGPALWAETFTGQLRPLDEALATACTRYSFGLEEREASVGSAPWQAVVAAHPRWLVGNAIFLLPDVVIVQQWPYRGASWAYRRSDATPLHRVTDPARAGDCGLGRWTPGDAALMWCSPEERMLPGGISAPMLAFFATSLTEAPVVWHPVDSGMPFPRGQWFVDDLSCDPNNWPACVRDGRSQVRIDWLGQFEDVAPNAGAVRLRHAALSTYGRWHLSVQAPREHSPCPASKVGCWSRSGPWRLLITDVSTGTRRWIPVDGKEGLNELELDDENFLPYWTYDGAIYAKATSHRRSHAPPLELYVGRADEGLTRRELPAGITDVRLLTRERGVGWGEDQVAWTADGGRTWTTVDVSRRDQERRTPVCDELGCFVDGVWVGWD